jgi:hypothetical protein
LSNGSVILIDGGVFATYNLEENSPSFLNDKNLYFPGLPEGLRSGVLDPTSSSGNMYEMFTADTVNKYDAYSKQILAVQKLSNYIHCNPK